MGGTSLGARLRLTGMFSMAIRSPSERGLDAPPIGPAALHQLLGRWLPVRGEQPGDPF